jgi:2,3-bisphosphoglycerate-independent phosphoglycerate mutase
MSELTLKPLSNYNPFPGPVVFVIMDGVGIGPAVESNGVHMAYTPVLDRLWKERLHTQLKAHGTAVGMPSDEDMGNSEVGHNALGAGRVFAQGAKLVSQAIQSGAIFGTENWKGLLQTAQEGTVHFIGLLSDGNVHSHVDHLYALIDRCVADGVKRVRVHVLLDGRDVAPKSALDYVKPLEEKLKSIRDAGKDYKIASGGGRMVTTMDRYNADWRIVERGWKAHVLGDARAFSTASEAVQTYYDEDKEATDQYLPSFVVAENGKPVGTVQDGDAVVFFNFRGDRAIELTKAFEEGDGFKEFDRVRHPKVFYAGMMQYDGDARIPSKYLVNPPALERTVGHYMCAKRISSYAISETQKFGHVTYFWNGNNSGYIDESIEKYVEIKSDLVPFDQRPWMKAAEITDAVIDTIRKGDRKFIRINYPNGDMVGHTGVPIAVRISVEAVDLCLGRLLPVVEAAKGIAVITADHGNADCMWTEKDGKRTAMTAHTLNPVPFTIADYSGANSFSMRAGIQTPGLSDVAATLLNLLGYEKPEDYDESLISIGK